MPTEPMSKAKYTPPALAKRWGISVKKVMIWLHSGELKSMNGATRIGQRPRFLIDQTALEEFEAKRLFRPEVAA